MNEGLIPRRYAKALLKLATERGCAGRVYTLMGNLADECSRVSSMQKAAANPFLAFKEKVRLLATAAGASSTDTIFTDFLKLLEMNKRMSAVRECAIAYVELYRRVNSIYRVEVTSAAKLDRDQEKRLKAMIEKHLGGGSMEYSTRIDPDLIGGFAVKIDNERLDASVATELEQMRHRLLG